MISLYCLLAVGCIISHVKLLPKLEWWICSIYILQQRSKDLTDQQHIVTLMIDEVYTAQRVEHSNGAFVGVTETGLSEKTVLTFMVQSTCAKYKDVCLIPLNKLGTTTLRYWFNQVMLSLHNFFLIIPVSVDNHVCNRYEYYC